MHSHYNRGGFPRICAASAFPPSPKRGTLLDSGYSGERPIPTSQVGSGRGTGWPYFVKSPLMRNMLQAWGTWCVLGAHLQHACHRPRLHGALHPGLFDFPHDPHPLATQMVHQRYSTSGDLWAQEGLYAQPARIYPLYWAGKLHGSHESSKLSQRAHDEIIPSYDVKTTSRRRFDVIMTLLLRLVSAGIMRSRYDTPNSQNVDLWRSRYGQTRFS